MHPPAASKSKSLELVCFSWGSRIGRTAKREGLINFVSSLLQDVFSMTNEEIAQL
ncbi:unnamed protein product [Penicillium camemberti]|uniref:Str. FM013 n=1 Tax=Penicillium camemberti (strain FM 013) TaxID=1429867 RepID=A0A0G4P6X0_PENC3|nr:unnamed protein product [Penicillium camemberti]